jgi:anti-anti-sigma factor
MVAFTTHLFKDFGQRFWRTLTLEISMAAEPSFHCEVEKSGDKSTGTVTTVKCHGRLVSDTAPQMKEVVKPLIPLGGRIVIDLTDLKHLDSSGLGTLVGLKASAIKEGYCTLVLANLSPHVRELLRLTNLTQMFSA